MQYVIAVMLRFAKRRLFRFSVSGRFVFFLPFRLRTRVRSTFHVSRRFDPQDLHLVLVQQRFSSAARPTAQVGGARERWHMAHGARGRTGMAAQAHGARGQGR